MVDWKEPHNVAACARCGSGRVHPKLLVMGPIAGIDSDSRSYICEVCHYEGLPVIFDTDEQRARFERETHGTEAAAPPPTVTSVPILPILTEPLLNVPILDSIPAQVASVVGVRWEGGRLAPTPYRVPFRDYWAAIGGPRYNASVVYMMDLTGISRGDPNFEVMRALVKRCDVWLDLGAQDSDDIMDGFMLDVERVVLGTKTLPSLDVFQEAYGLSPEVVPCIEWDGRVVWKDTREKRTGLEEVAAALRDIGFVGACVMDLRRLGTEGGPDPAFLTRLGSLELKVLVGGGVQETDIEPLIKRGFAGGIVDPYTPVIRDLLKPPKSDEPTAATAPEPVARPSPSSRALPDV